MKISNGLQTKAMLVNLAISRWYANKRDPELSREVTTNHKAKDGSARVNKSLLPFDCPEYSGIQSAANQARLDHYNMTLPWGDDGWRIIPSGNYFFYIEKMKSHKAEFENGVSGFVPRYTSLRDRSKVESGTLFKDRDWPDINTVQGKFGFAIKFKPIPDADFRVSIQGDEIEEVRSEIRNEVQAEFEKGNKDIWTRLHAAVTRIAERLSDDKYGPRETLLGNLVELCDMIPRLNFMDDQKLEAIRQRVVNELTQYKQEDLKIGEPLREEAQKKAADIKAVMDAIMQR